MKDIIGADLWMPSCNTRINFHPIHEIHLREFRLT